MISTLMRKAKLRHGEADKRRCAPWHHIPIVTVANGSGPTVLLCAGNHGEEDEGQLILRRLIHELEPSDVQGRIIFMPALGYPAVHACTRTSPLDDGNLNRSFPGDGSSGPTPAIASFVVDMLVPLAGAVLPRVVTIDSAVPPATHQSQGFK